jgi:hypothetical protein
MPDVTASIAPDEVRMWVAIDQHKFSIVAASLPGVPPTHTPPPRVRLSALDRH